MKKSFLILVMIFFLYQIFANEMINSDYSHYLNYLNLTGQIDSPNDIYSSLSNNVWDEINFQHPWDSHFKYDRVMYNNDWMKFELLDPEIYMSYNSALPHSLNDGAIWQGKGFNSSFKTGFRWDTKYLDITFYPEIWFAENQDFTILPSVQSDPYGYFNGNADFPQRLGESAVYKYSWGQSDIRFNWRSLTVGISTENIKIGPAIQNPLILSSNANGFPHLDFGLRKTETLIGSFEARTWLGLLKESDNYNDNSSDDHRLFSGWNIGYSPMFLKGLTIGLNWVINTPGGAFDPVYIFPHISEIFGIAAHKGYDETDQKISITFDWKFPSVGFNVYFEWAREDFFPDLINTLLTPEHSQFITLGLRQAIPINFQRGFLVSFELSDLIQSRDYEIGVIGPGGNYYMHHKVYHGYTNEGQILGASIGPGSDSQYLEIKYYDNWGSLKIFGRRISWDKMYMYKDPSNTPDDMCCNLLRLKVQIDLGLGGNFLYRNFNFFSDITGSYTLNQNYIEDNNIFNFRMDLGIKYRY